MNYDAKSDAYRTATSYAYTFPACIRWIDFDTRAGANITKRINVKNYYKLTSFGAHEQASVKPTRARERACGASVS